MVCPYQLVSVLVGVDGWLVLFSLFFASVRVSVDFHRLHDRCMWWQLLRSYGDPPLLTGMSSSMTPAMGSRWWSVWSIAFPQRAQLGSSALTLFESFRRRFPFACLGLLMLCTLCVGGGFSIPLELWGLSCSRKLSCT